MNTSKRVLAVVVALGVATWIGWANGALAQQMPKPGGPGAPGVERPGGAGEQQDPAGGEKPTAPAAAEKPSPAGAAEKPSPPGATMGKKEVVGTIKSVDHSGKMLTLDDGT